ncbi:MAG: acetylornithine deacetylase [Myxococcaceae bacterium]|nr:acetylornithine deacetylase [Myxococcaceae bacterium]
MSDELLSTLRDLVAIDSTSVRTNQPVLDVLEPQLTALGFHCLRHRYRDDSGVEKANLVATLGGGGPLELALVGHTDCVPFDAQWAEALVLTERDGKLYGRGSCDTKAFIACALEAARRVASQLKRPLGLCFTADEEVGCVGAKKLQAGKLLDARRAIIGEPTSLTPVRANKGYCLAEVEFTGKEGHSAYPASGVSAVFHAARFVTQLEAFSLEGLRVQTDATFEPPFTTLNVGVIAGGKAKNIIPGHCRVTLEWRPIPGQNVRFVLEQVEAMLRDLHAADETFNGKVTPLRMDSGFDTAAEQDVVRFLETATGNASKTVAFGTEGPQLAALGAVPVVFGPGDIRVAHQTGEFVPKAELLRAAEVLESAIRHFCCA